MSSCKWYALFAAIANVHVVVAVQRPPSEQSNLKILEQGKVESTAVATADVSVQSDPAGDLGSLADQLMRKEPTPGLGQNQPVDEKKSQPKKTWRQQITSRAAKKRMPRKTRTPKHRVDDTPVMDMRPESLIEETAMLKTNSNIKAMETLARTRGCTPPPSLRFAIQGDSKKHLIEQIIE